MKMDKDFERPVVTMADLPSPRACVLDFPKDIVKLTLADYIIADSSFVKATFADGRTLVLSGRPDIPFKYGVYLATVAGGYDMLFTDKRVIASLSRFYREKRANPQQYGIRAWTARPGDDIPLLTPEEVEREWEGRIPGWGESRLREALTLPFWPFPVWA